MGLPSWGRVLGYATRTLRAAVLWGVFLTSFRSIRRRRDTFHVEPSGPNRRKSAVASVVLSWNVPLLVGADERYSNQNSELSILAVSAQITEVTYSISDVQTRIFGETIPLVSLPSSRRDRLSILISLSEIQELRHQAEATQSSTSTSAAVSLDGHGQAVDTSTTNIDQALINLDERLEAIASSISSIERVLAPVIASAKTPTTSKTLTQATVYAEDPTGALLRKHSNMLQEWDAVQEEAETLKGELREDKWLAVFRTVGEQAEAMMVSLEKAVTHCQDFIWQVHRHRRTLNDDRHSGVSSGSTSGERPIDFEMFQSLLSSYEAKKRYYMPATTKVLAILDRSVRDRVTKNGECLRRHAEARARWKNLRERLNRIDAEMEQVRLYFVSREKEQEPEPSEAGSALSRQTSRSNYTSKSNYLSTPSTRVSALTSRSRADSGSGSTPSAFSRSMSPLKRFASKVTASVRSGSSSNAGGTGTPSRTASSVSIPSPQPPLSAFSSSVSVSDANNAPPKPPPRSPFRPPANRISAVSSPVPPDPVDDEGKEKEKRKRDSSIFPFLSKPPPPSALGRSNNRAPSRSSMSGGDTSASGSSKPRWNSSTKVEHQSGPLPPSQNATIRATPASGRQSIFSHVFRPLSPSSPNEERRSLSRSESRPPTSQGKHKTFSSVSTVDLNGNNGNVNGNATPQRPRSRAASRAGARTPSGGMYGTTPRTRPVTPSHIPAPISYLGMGRSPSRAASDNDWEDELPTSLMQRVEAVDREMRASPDGGGGGGLKQRRMSNSMIPVPKLNVTSGSRPGTALSMAGAASRSSSPQNSLAEAQRNANAKESPSAWKRLSIPQDSPSNPFKDRDSPAAAGAGRAGARSQTPEAMLRARALQMPLYLENPSPGGGGSGSPSSSSHLTPGGSKVSRANAPSSFKGEAGRTLVFSPGSSGADAAGRPPS
ncbi:hypothetical protein FRC17_002354, partial [Serendipita sp. 399]